ncbi:MAG: 1-phosphofructokinase family hexose kinase [Chitinophaga sp.]|uniref:1-phosphofructokinase family hexose kinase n=1 Tax=Chitinophaga sp. TaxID=1869181 RepID=UPI0025C1CF7F|nr:1-phosphofructokinase family hexose kinase [Chitinophaga sp.]MBV8251898.1 1-phosphofructokinase family hexose kinase [Chitinophaga sp.]
MSLITTVTFNPAIDKSVTVSALVPEKKLKCTAPVFEPGGGGVNVARAIKKLGGEATAVYMAGGYTGNFFNSLLDAEAVPYMMVPISSHTRENLIVMDQSTGLQYRFGMPGPVVSLQEFDNCLDIIRHINTSWLVVSGSLPADAPPEIYSTIVTIAKERGIKCIVDTSGAALKAAVEVGVYLIKPNLSELSFLVGKESLLGNEVAIAAKEIIATGGCEVVVVSLGPAGAMVVTDKLIQTIAAPTVKCCSTVGAGDCMVAGIVDSLARGKDIVDAVRYGVACGTAATLNPGTALFKLEDLQLLYKNMRLADHLQY